MKCMYFSIKYRYSDILLKKPINFILTVYYAAITPFIVLTWFHVKLEVRYITSASHYHPGYQSRSLMYIRGLIPRNITEVAEEVLIAKI